MRSQFVARLHAWSFKARTDQMSFRQHLLDAAAAKRSFFVDALTSTVALPIDLDIQLTLIASTFYRVLEQ